jgi:hypothetical protein
MRNQIAEITIDENRILIFCYRDVNNNIEMSFKGYTVTQKDKNVFQIHTAFGPSVLEINLKQESFSLLSEPTSYLSLFASNPTFGMGTTVGSFSQRVGSKVGLMRMITWLTSDPVGNKTFDLSRNDVAVSMPIRQQRQRRTRKRKQR